MSPRIVKTPKFVTWLYPKRIWAFSREIPKIYLTFDDGPIPEVTPWVLDVLKKYQAKATFFCIGENVKKHPNIFMDIIQQGHSVGNHTQHHANGWGMKNKKYLEEISTYQETINKIQNQIHNLKSRVSNLLRPPYGKITQKQARTLQQKGFKIIMWDVLSYDWDNQVSEEKCLQNILKNIDQGSIVVFHDSLKAEKNLRFVLPKVLEFIKQKGWIAEKI